MTVHRLQRPPDGLSPAARRQFVRLFGELRIARRELHAIEVERKTRASGSSFADLNARHQRAEERWSDAIITLELGLGKHPNEAVQATWPALLERISDELRGKETEPPPNRGATILRFPTATRADDDPWMTSKESAAHAKRLSKNGHVSSGWRKVLLELEASGDAARQGAHPNSQLRVRRSTVDAVISRQLTIGEEP